MFSNEEKNLLQASVLHYARTITEAAAEGAKILDCVITVPAFWGPVQRQALIDAARVSGRQLVPTFANHPEKGFINLLCPVYSPLLALQDSRSLAKELEFVSLQG